MGGEPSKGEKCNEESGIDHYRHHHRNRSCESADADYLGIEEWQGALPNGHLRRISGRCRKRTAADHIREKYHGET